MEMRVEKIGYGIGKAESSPDLSSTPDNIFYHTEATPRLTKPAGGSTSGWFGS